MPEHLTQLVSVVQDDLKALNESGTSPNYNGRVEICVTP